MKNLAKSFKIWPCLEAGPEYFVVRIFPTIKDMYKYSRSLEKRSGFNNEDANWVGMCRTWSRMVYPKDRRPYKHPQMGIILLTSEARSDVVVHELTHAALRFCKRRRLKASNLYRSLKWEEFFCYLVSDMYVEYQRRVGEA